MNRLLGNKRRASFDVNQRPLTYKVYYLGNVTTSLTRGDGCADRPAKILWDMHLKNQGRLGRKLLLTVTNSGLQAENYKKTDLNTNDITLYCTNRISYYLVADKFNPKMFIWVYRHVNIRSGLTTELRCHACLCSNESDAKSLVDLLHQHVQESLREYVREKYRRQISRLAMNSSSTQIDRILNEPPKRLLTRSQASNYRPSLARSMSNIGLGRMDNIEEDDDELIDSETQTTLSTTSTVSSSSIDLITTKLTDKPSRLYAHALSDIL